jgi:hypothetical protein
MVPHFSGNNNWIKLCHTPPFKFAIPVKEKGDRAAGLIEFPPCSRAVLTDALKGPRVGIVAELP